ncbi:MAG: hypothetical protein WBX25_28825 [Rhodomicrobium sp.]
MSRGPTWAVMAGHPTASSTDAANPSAWILKDRIISLPNGCPPNPERLFEINDGEGREAVLEQLGLWRAAMLRKAEDKRSALRCFRRALDWV